MKTPPNNVLMRLGVSVIFAVWCVLFAPAAVAAITQGLSFGVLPYKAPQRLLSDLAPLGDLLSQSTGRPVSILTTKDYPEFIRRIQIEDFDILLTAPHFARLAETDAHYQAIAMTGYQVQAVLLVPLKSPIKSVAELQGKVIAMPQRESLIYQLGRELLRAQGLEQNHNVVFHEYTANQLAMAAPLRGDADASVGGQLLWQTSGLQKELRVLAESKALAGLVLMVHPRVSQLTIQNLRSAVLAFGQTAAGAAYLKASGHLSWQPVAPDSLRAMDSYARAIPR